MKKFEINNQYALFIIKDNFTSREFVKKILTFIFDKSEIEAEYITKQIWIHDKVYVASYIKEIAIVKKIQVERNAKNYGFPLKIILEEK